MKKQLFEFFEQLLQSEKHIQEVIAMQDFPSFMKNPKNRINTNDQNTPDIEGYFYNGADGSQMAFWTCYADRVSRKHTHEFDEYMVCVSGRYTVIMNDKEYVLMGKVHCRHKNHTCLWRQTN